MMDEYKIERVTGDEENAVYDFLVKWFFTAEPITCSWPGPPPKDVLSCTFALRHGFSFKAVDKSGQIAALCINADEKKLDQEVPTDRLPDNLARLYEFFDQVTKEASPGPDLLGLHVIVVRESSRRQGLSAKLVLASEALAKESGYKGMKVLCSSSHSAAVVKRLGWECILDKPYTEYTDPATGKPKYAPDLPHTHVRFYVKKF